RFASAVVTAVEEDGSSGPWQFQGSGSRRNQQWLVRTGAIVVPRERRRKRARENGGRIIARTGWSANGISCRQPFGKSCMEWRGLWSACGGRRLATWWWLVGVWFLHTLRMRGAFTRVLVTGLLSVTCCSTTAI